MARRRTTPPTEPQKSENRKERHKPVEGKNKPPTQDTTPNQKTTTPEQLLQDWWQNHNTQQTPTGPHTNQPVIIYWWDAISNPDWQDHTDTLPPAPTTTIGWITHHNNTHTTLTPFTNQHTWCNTVTIPNGCIHHIQTLTTT